MRYQRRLKPFSGTLDVAPFLGVGLILVIFMALHSRFAPPPGIGIRLPENPEAELPGLDRTLAVVVVDSSEQIYFDHQAISEAKLGEKLARRVKEWRGSTSLLLQADTSVRHGTIVRLATLARKAGIREIWEETRQTPQPKTGLPGGTATINP